jgi:hypothetical protein
MKVAEICRGRIVTKYLLVVSYVLSHICTVVGTAYNGKYSVLRAVMLCDQTVVIPQSSEDLRSQDSQESSVKLENNGVHTAWRPTSLHCMLTLFDSIFRIM